MPSIVENLPSDLICEACPSPCIPSRGTKVADRQEWFHEVKHDGYRLMIQRDGARVRLWTRNGQNWSNHFPLIVEAALRHRSTSFVIDGEAVLLGVDGISDFDGLRSRQHDAEVQFYAFDLLVTNGEDPGAAAALPKEQSRSHAGAADRRHHAQ